MVASGSGMPVDISKERIYNNFENYTTVTLPSLAFSNN
jgi:hypothetical protein